MTTAKAPIRLALLSTTLGLLSLVLVACNRPVIAERPPQAGDVAVAKVNGRVVWKSDVVREAVAQGLIGEGEPLDVSSDVFHRTLDEVIDQKLLAAEAITRKLDKDPAAQRRLASARERILSDMLVESVVEKAVNDNAIRTLYEEQLKSAKQDEEFHGRQIVLPSQGDAEAVKKLLASGASFDAVALERSSDSETKFNGGDLGYFTLDVMPDPYGQALKAAKPGDIVGPFQTEAGWVLVKVEDRRAAQPITLESARPQIVRFLTYDQVRDLLETLRSHSQVQTLIAPAKDAGKEPASAPSDAAVVSDTPASDAPPVAAPPAAPKAQTKAKS
ncbi:MAG TPA: peptidylprolyl isomerase [Caulobacteraceae bacterium]|nr:peptidylprolyl isomerase [Caulobacteraceae bacterium]